MKRIPLSDDSSIQKPKCTTCLLPLQYQTKKHDKFLWQCFKCGKQFLVSENNEYSVDESWSPPR